MPRTLTGRSISVPEPNWKPLIDLIGLELVDWFMWMFAIELSDGTRVHAYKHRTTRRYFHLGEDGRAFAYIPRYSYLEIDAGGSDRRGVLRVGRALPGAGRGRARGARRSSGVEQAAPAQPRIAAEAAIERDELRPLLERERRQIRVGDQVARAAAGGGRGPRSAPSACAPARTSCAGGSSSTSMKSSTASTGSGRTNTREFVARRTTLASATSLRPMTALSPRASSRKRRAELVVHVVGAEAREQDVDVRQQHRRRPRPGARRSTTDRSTAAGRRPRSRPGARRRRPRAVDAPPSRRRRPSASKRRQRRAFLSGTPAGLPEQFVGEVDGGTHAANCIAGCSMLHDGGVRLRRALRDDFGFGSARAPERARRARRRAVGPSATGRCCSPSAGAVWPAPGGARCSAGPNRHMTRLRSTRGP